MRRVVMMVLASGLTVHTALAADSAARPRLAVAEFEMALAGRTLPPQDLGLSAAQLMVDRLVLSGAFQVYDAHWLAKRGSQGGPADVDGLRAAAERLGIDYLAVGTITQFSEEQSYRRFGGAAFPLPILGGAGRRTAQLLVSVLVKLVDVRTGEIVTTATGMGAATRTNIKAGALALLRVGGAGGYARGSDNARDAQLGEAIQRSVEHASAGLVGWRDRVSSPRGE